MATYIRSLATIALLTTSATLTAAQSGSGKTTRYWDCCKPHCAWPGRSSVGVVGICDKDDQPLNDPNALSACSQNSDPPGPAYMCSSQTAWAVSDDLAYGFAAVSMSNPACCQCFQLTFTSAPITGKKMIVQATNTGTDVHNAQFDIAMPGGGFGLYDGCTTQWNATSAVWGQQQYGGSITNTCHEFPPALQSGCSFRWDWMKGADNPDVDYEVVTCPSEIVAKSGCGTGGGSSPAPDIAAPAASNQASEAASSQPSNASPPGGAAEAAPNQPPAPAPPQPSNPSPPAQGDSGASPGASQPAPSVPAPQEGAAGQQGGQATSTSTTSSQPSQTASGDGGNTGLQHPHMPYNPQSSGGATMPETQQKASIGETDAGDEAGEEEGCEL
ncbi:MAG: hypothetical protein Q9163_004401 [Psora crenata]